MFSINTYTGDTLMSQKRLRHSYVMLIILLILTLSLLAITTRQVNAQTPAEGETYTIGRYKTIPVPYNATVVAAYVSDIKNDGNYAFIRVTQDGTVRVFSLDGNTIWTRYLKKTITYSLLFDMDRDNLPELLLGTSDGYIIELDPASFGLTVFNTYLTSDFPVLKIVPANIDSDNQSEFIVVQENGPISIVDNTGTFLKSYRYYAKFADVVATDINNDNSSEIFLVTSDGKIRIMYPNGTDIFSTSILGEHFTSVIAADVDNDGLPEFFVAGVKTLYVYASDGTQLKTRSFDYSILKMAIVDLDKNGIDDLMILSGNELYSINARTILLNNFVELPKNYTISNMVFLNIDTDDALEILLTTYQGVILIYDNDFSLFRVYTVEASAPIYSCEVIDLDSDGYDEFVVAGRLRNVVLLGIDTDGDGLLNIEENTITKTNPNLIDTDGDQMSDYDEYLNGRNPLMYDSDYDGIPDGLDITNGINDTFFYAAILLVFIGVPGYKYIQLRKEETV